jgi:predicted regulator of Ras-like GTPase activity (Roadblock/LC7/MglB family)
MRIHQSIDLQAKIEHLAATVPHITGVLIATVDGLPLASKLRTSDPDLVAAMTATALGIGKRLSQTHQLEPLEAVIVQGQQGYIFVYSIGQLWVVMVETNSQVIFGLVKFSVQELVQQLTALINTRSE